MQIVAQGWLIYSLTGSAVDLGLVGVARSVPILGLTTVGGVVADRAPRLLILRAAQSFNVVLSLALAIMVALDAVNVWMLVSFALLAGTSTAFEQPARQAILPDLVKREHLTNAIALHDSVWQGSALIGPALAGVAMAAIGTAGAFFANTLGYLSVLIALLLMRNVPEHLPRSESRGLFDDYREGLRFIRATRVVLGLLLLAAAANIFGRSYQQLLPIFAGDVLDVGPTGLGLLLSAPGAGSVLAAFGVGMSGDVRRKGLVHFLAMVLFGAVLVGFAISRSFPLSLALLLVTGLSFTIFSTMTSTMMQLSAPNHIRGRVMSFNTIVMQGFAPLGSLIVGAVGTSIGTANAVGMGAALVTVAAILSLSLAPELLRFRAPVIDSRRPALA
jgi:predicted MFS family arabinose efflux permease